MLLVILNTLKSPTTLPGSWCNQIISTEFTFYFVLTSHFKPVFFGLHLQFTITWFTVNT